MGKYTAGIMMAKASGKAAKSPRPPKTSQVSLPSQIGAIVFMIVLREAMIGRETEKHAYAEIEAVEQDIEEHCHPQDYRP